MNLSNISQWWQACDESYALILDLEMTSDARAEKLKSRAITRYYRRHAKYWKTNTIFYPFQGQVIFNHQIGQPGPPGLN